MYFTRILKSLGRVLMYALILFGSVYLIGTFEKSVSDASFYTAATIMRYVMFSICLISLPLIFIRKLTQEGDKITSEHKWRILRVEIGLVFVFAVAEYMARNTVS